MAPLSRERVFVSVRPSPAKFRTLRSFFSPTISTNRRQSSLSPPPPPPWPVGVFVRRRRLLVYFLRCVWSGRSARGKQGLLLLVLVASDKTTARAGGQSWSGIVVASAGMSDGVSTFLSSGLSGRVARVSSIVFRVIKCVPKPRKTIDRP